MKKRYILLPVLAVLLILLLSAAVPCLAEEAENLTPDCTVKVVDNPGKRKCITDGEYTTFWESSKRKNPYVIISSEKPIYGLYLCFQKMPDTYVIQKESGDDWVTVAEGGSPRFHHVFFELDGLTKIRILSTEAKKNVMGFNEIYAFGQGETPEWVQRWKEHSGKTDILFLATHPDDDVLFLGSAITWYAAELKKNIMVAYLTDSNTTRRSEALNGLWAMGVRVYPEFGNFSDRYSNPAKIEQEYKDMGGQDAVLGWITEIYRKYRPSVVVTQDIEGEYGHPQHKMTVDAAIKCWDKAADETAYPDSASQYGTWEVQKLYLHLYGEDAESTAFNWDIPMESMGGKTANEVSEAAFAYHVTQAGKGKKFNGVRVPFSVAEYGVKRYPNNKFGLYATRAGQDVSHTDFLEHIEETADAEDGGAEEPKDELKEPEEGKEENAAVETEEEPVTEEREAKKEPVMETITDFAADPGAPEWADVTLNERGYLDSGYYLLEDEENGHWMYVDRTLRIQVERSWETPEKVQKSDPVQKFFCYTAEIWCDIENGEFPKNVWSNPEKKGKDPKYIDEIAAENKLIYAVSADYYQYRVSQKSSKKSYRVGIELRDGEIRWDDPNSNPPGMPTYETLAIFADGHVESYPSTERDGAYYQENGAVHVYTFGPCLIKDGVFTEQVAKANRKLNPRHAFGMVNPGHYIDVICEGRLKTKNGSTGVMMETLAKIMLDRGCRVAVNLDGGDTAVCAFMGKKLNLVVDPNSLKLNRGRSQVEALGFGVLEDGQ